MSSLRAITAEEWRQMSGDRDVVLVDLRTPDAYRRQHIEGAVNIPYEQLRRIVPLRRRKLVLYCERGVTSAAAGVMLADRGYRVLTLKGGIEEYLRKNRV